MRGGPLRALWLAAVSAGARAPGFLIPLVVGAVFGAGAATDAYFIAYGAVLLVGGTLGQSVEVSIVPFAARALAGAEPDRRFLDRKALRTGVAAAAMWVVVVPLLALVSPALAPRLWGYGGCFTLLTVGWAAAAVYAGALVSQARIGSASASLLWRGGGGALGFALAPAGAGLWSVALGLGVGEWARVWWLRRSVLGLRTRVGTTAGDSLGAFRWAAAAIAFAGLAGSGVPVVEKLLATGLGSGAASYLEYAVRLLMVPAVLFDGALGPLLLSRLAHEAAVQGRPVTLRSAASAVMTGAAVALTVAAALALAAGPLVRLLLVHGRFTLADADQVVAVLRLMSVGFVFAMTSLLVERLFLARARTRAVALLSLPRGGLRLATALLLLPHLGLMAFPVGYISGEVAYLGGLLVAARR